MYSFIYNTHKITVILFLALYVIKTFLLLTNKTQLLEKIKAATKVPEMVISALFLLSGIYMVFQYPMMGIIYYIKLFCVFVSIPLAIVGFKKNNKILASAAISFLFAAYGLAEINKNSLNRNFSINPDELANKTTIEQKGKLVYEKACIMCHGSEGDAGIAGAANLQTSLLDDAAKKDIIKNGKKSMPKFNKLSNEQIDQVSAYIAKFKK